MPLPKNYKYTPIPKPFFISQSEIHGMGIFCNLDIEEDSIFFDRETHTRLTTGELLRSGLGSFINHDANANCTLWSDQPDKNGIIMWYLLAKRDIKPMEEITLDYNVEMCGLFNECE